MSGVIALAAEKLAQQRRELENFKGRALAAESALAAVPGEAIRHSTPQVSIEAVAESPASIRQQLDAATDSRERWNLAERLEKAEEHEMAFRHLSHSQVNQRLAVETDPATRFYLMERLAESE